MSKSFTPEELDASGGWAFPCHHTPEHEPGMTLRDWFAGQALAGFMNDLGHHLANDDRPERAARSIKNSARLSYLVADAMIALRDEPSDR